MNAHCTVFLYYFICRLWRQLLFRIFVSEMLNVTSGSPYIYSQMVCDKKCRERYNAEIDYLFRTCQTTFRPYLYYFRKSLVTQLLYTPLTCKQRLWESTALYFWWIKTWKVFMECGYHRLGIRPARVCDSGDSCLCKNFIIHMRVSVPAPNAQAGTGVHHDSNGSGTRPLSLYYVSGLICSVV